MALRAFLESRADIGPTFNFTNLLYYFGGLIAIGAKLKPFDTKDYRLIAGTYDSTRAAIF